MTGLRELLEELGLTQYQDVFAAEDVDLDVLRQLTDDDLKKLGLSLGHRRKLIAAAADAGRTAVPAVAPVPNGRSSPQAAPIASEKIERSAGPVAGGERRQLTVLFSDLVGSTEMSSRFDPEQVGQMLAEYQKIATSIVGQFDGYLDRFVGDGMLVYFGYPQAREDAAESAVRAALAVAAAVARIRTPDGQRLNVRAAVASGLVFIDRHSSRGAEQLVTGEVLNIAARLQQIAKPGAVVVAAGTHQLIGGLFDCKHLGLQLLKGFSAPIPAWEVLSEGLAETRYEAQHADLAPPAVGREREIETLLDRWDIAKGGEGQVVLLSGEPGIGKSRISAAVRERIAGEPHVVIRYQCSPFHSNSPLYPAIAQLTHAAGIERGDSPDVRLDKVERLLRGSPADLRQSVPIVAALLSIPSGARYPEVVLSAEERMQRTLGILVDQLVAIAAESPVLLVVEDAHWIDPTTRELLTLSIDRLQQLRVLAIITSRPEFQHDWAGLPHVMLLPLNRLTRRQILMMIEQVVGQRQMPPEVMDQIVSRTDGVPLFVEELTKALLESGWSGEGVSGPARAARQPEIPMTLQDSLLARLDHLPGAHTRDVAQIGAVIGREFSFRLLTAMAELAPDMLIAALGRLVHAGLLHQRGTPPNATYLFKHALVQDTAYSALMLRRRRELHARCAEALAQDDPDIAEKSPELLAYHYDRADMAEPAIRHWLLAGRRAAARSANLEAIGHFTGARAALERLPENEERDRLEMQTLVGLGMPLIAVKGYGAEEAGAVWSRASELAEARNDADHLISSLYGVWAYQISLGHYDVALRTAERLHDFGRQNQDDGVVLVGHRITGLTRHTMGDQAAARAEFETALSLYDLRQHQPLAFRFGQDQRVAALAFLGTTRWLQGCPDQALQVASACVDHASDLKHANSFAYALAWGACPVAELCGDISDLDRLSGQLLDYASERALHRWHAYGLAYRGLVLVERGEFAGGLKLQHQAIAEFRRRGSGLRDSAHLATLARCLGLAGSAGEGLVLIDEALGEARRRSEGWHLPELLRVKGELMLVNDDARVREAAAALFHEAIAASQAHGMLSWELRAAMSLARLWRDQGRDGAARTLLATTYDKFTEGFETADLQHARAQLADLNG